MVCKRRQIRFLFNPLARRPFYASFLYVGYQIQYSENPNDELSWRVDATTPDQSQLIIHDLKERTRYYFRMRATNNAGNGPFTDTTSVTTDRLGGCHM